MTRTLLPHQVLLRRSALVATLAALLCACAAVGEVPVLGDGDSGGSDTGVRPGPRDTGSGDTTPQPDVAPADTADEIAEEDAVASDTVDSAPDADEPEVTEPDVAEDAAPEVADVGREASVDEECEQISAVADPIVAPVDIVFVVDTSGSMGEEMAIVQSQINNFVASITSAADLDYRVVMIAADRPCSGCAGSGICVPEPLSGAPGCPDTDSERYFHVREVVGSFNALERIHDTWDRFSAFLRPDAVTHFVVVSDDESDRNPDWFNTRMAPRLPGGFVFHSIVSLVETESCFLFICETEGCSGPHGDAESRGSTYIALSTTTGGIAASICDADWAPIFSQIADSVVRGAALACEYTIPPAPFGEILYDSVRVEFIEAGGSRAALEQVPNAAACRAANQWYYDDPAAPTTVHLCPAACGDRVGSIEIFFDCVKA